MKKYGIVFGAAAVAVIAGCKDPDYKYANRPSPQNDVKVVDATTSAPADVVRPVEISDARRCTCAPGTRHDKPCACGAPDCMCVVEVKPVVTADLSKPVAPAPAVEEATTTYIVQSGDYLAKISKKFNVTISSIKRLNPSIGAKNIVRVGQKLKLPGTVDVGVQAEPAKPAPAARGVKKPYAPYAGATKEYVVKSGDTLGAIAYSNGINIRQLKELNGLTKDVLRVGQKIKIPAEKVVAGKPLAKAAPEKAPAASAAPVAAPQQAAPAAASEPTLPPAAPDAAAVTAPAAPSQPQPDSSAAATTTYVVQEGDDMTGVSIRWGVSAADIRELNNLGDKDQLVPGQIIKLPADAQQ